MNLPFCKSKKWSNISDFRGPNLLKSSPPNYNHTLLPSCHLGRAISTLKIQVGHSLKEQSFKLNSLCGYDFSHFPQVNENCYGCTWVNVIWIEEKAWNLESDSGSYLGSFILLIGHVLYDKSDFSKTQLLWHQLSLGEAIYKTRPLSQTYKASDPYCGTCCFYASGQVS